MANKKKRVKISNLKLNLFVRQSLNYDHGFYLAELIDSGVKLPPIKITPDNEVIDGRHRVWAYDYLDIGEIMAEIVDVETEADLIGMAYKANIGGALPPTTKDTSHTITRLIELKETNKRISEILGLEPSMTRKIVSEVRSRMNRAKLVQASAAVTDGGMTVPLAAKKFGVDIDKLKAYLGGGRGPKRVEIGEIKRRLTTQSRSSSSKNASLLRSLLDKLDDGELTSAQVTEVFKHLKNLQRLARKSVSEWEDRFRARTTS